jgi:glycosyltransferase involved in cell wall biosynthesis
MRIMIVTSTLPYLPCHEAARLLPARLLLHLGGEHEVALVAAAGVRDTPAQRRWAASLAARTEIVPAGRWRHPLTGLPAEGLEALRDGLRRALDAFGPDVVHLEGALLAPLAGAGGVPTVLACHGSAALAARESRRLARQPWRWMRAHLDERVESAWERRWVGRADACVVDSEDDRGELAAYLPFDKLHIVPAGIDERQYAFRTSGDPGRIVFTGALDGPRDGEAARRLALRIFPRVQRLWPRAELLIAGDAPVPAVRALGAVPGVRVTGAAPDLRPSVWSAGVYASPLDAGFGGNARLLEAMALGTPVVACRRSLSGLCDVLPGHHVLTAETDDDFADALLTLLREPVIARTIAHNARRLVERRYTWPAVVRHYQALYEQVGEARSAVAVAA